MHLKSIAMMVTGLLIMQPFNVYAANAHTATEGGGRILDAIEAEQADAAALTAETDVFKSIGMGLSLSIAQCEVLDQCTSIINPGELQTLLSTLDSRINGLIARQEQGGEDFTDLLTAYVDQRESYLRYQEKLQEIAGPELNLEEPSADSFGADTGVSGEQLDLSVFEDADDPLADFADEGALLEDDAGAVEEAPAEEPPVE